MGMDEPQAFGLNSTPDSKLNTKAQQEFHEAQEAAALEQATWPLYKVEILGDDREWVPRNDERYWKLENPDEPAGPDNPWVSIDGNPVIMPAKGTVTLRARSEDMARMMALRDNPDYHTIESVTLVEES